MMNKYILFDFDGVIADSFTAAFETAKYICPAITEVHYRKRFEGNIFEVSILEDFHSNECLHHTDWFDEIKNEVRIFSGMREVILKLREEYRLIIISSSPTITIKEFLSSHDLQDHFDWIMGNDVHKSKVEKIKMVFEKYKISGDDCIFVTDTLGDMHEAEKMHVPSIGVTWGFNDLETLQRGVANRLIDTPQELVRAVADYFTK